MFLYKRDDESLSDLGRATWQRALELCHQKHLEGQLAPDWQSCLREAGKQVSKEIVRRAKLNGRKNGKRTDDTAD